jgi:phage terminase small subunit
MASKKLTAKQERFVEEYLVDCNATQACIRAGYKAKNADVIGPELLGKTWEVIQLRQKQLAKIVHMSQERWVRRLEWLSRANIRKIMQWDEHGVRIKASEDLTEQEAWLISEVSEQKGKYGDSIKVKLTDKLAALIELGKALGYYPKEKPGDTFNFQQNNLWASTDPWDLSSLTPPEREQFLTLLRRAVPKVIGEGKGES